MRKVYAIFAILLMAVTTVTAATAPCDSVTAVTPSAKPLYRNVYGELNGPSNWIGASYDCRILPGSPFGYRAGISYISDDRAPVLTYGVGIPLEFNCILGNRASKFEVGVGADMIIYRKEFYPGSNVRNHYIGSGFGYYTYFNIGYRLQYRKGFNFRVGFSPSFAWGNHAVYKGMGNYIFPYLSFGYTFPK